MANRFTFIKAFATLSLIAATMLISTSCRSSRSGEIGLLGPSDETTQAAQLVAEANKELTRIKVLYKENEGKREELKKALESDNAADVRRLSDEIVYLINDGSSFAKSAIDKIAQAQQLNANDDYKEYLRLKEEALRLQLDAFENYRQAARALRDNYDPKNAQQRDKVKAEFKSRSDSYQKIMERARSSSMQANELAKTAAQRESQ